MSSSRSHLHFLGREIEISQLLAAFTQRQNIVISGAAGMGKSALIHHVAIIVPLFVCNQSTSIDQLCEDYLASLGLSAGTFSPKHRRAIALLRIKQDGYPIAFDSSNKTSTTRLSAQIGELASHVPIWLVTRSDPFESGHPFNEIREFAHLRLLPFKKNELRTVVALAASRKVLPFFAVRYAEYFYRYSKGSPQLLESLLRIVSFQKPESEDALWHCFDLFQADPEGQNDYINPG